MIGFFVRRFAILLIWAVAIVTISCLSDYDERETLRYVRGGRR
jgi:hypothetical protein